MKFLTVKKSDLPLPLVITDERGNFEVQELAPAGKKRLGAYVRQASELTKRIVRRFVPRK